MAIVNRSGFYCLIDMKGTLQVACGMDAIIPLENDILRLEKEEKMAYFDARIKKMMWQAKGF